MWSAEIQHGESPLHRIVAPTRAGEPLRYADALAGWERDAGFRDFFLAQLAAAPYAAWFWETPPVTRATLGRRFEFALVASDALARAQPDAGAFAEHFAADPDALVVRFESLRGDALLIAPRPLAPPSAYIHLAAFVRGAPENQQHALWQSVAAAVRERVGERPLWLSTNGLGVPWLHVRLDARPKYYSHRPYRTASVAR